MLPHYLPAADYEFCACTQEDDGTLNPPLGDGWMLISTNAAEDGDAAVLIATWARPRVQETAE